MKRALDILGTFSIVTIVTLLVWLYAEDANIREYTGEQVRVQFVLPAGSAGELSPGAPITISVDFDSSNGIHQQFVEQTARGHLSVGCSARLLTRPLVHRSMLPSWRLGRKSVWTAEIFRSRSVHGRR